MEWSYLSLLYRSSTGSKLSDCAFVLIGVLFRFRIGSPLTFVFAVCGFSIICIGFQPGWLVCLEYGHVGSQSLSLRSLFRAGLVLKLYFMVSCGDAFFRCCCLFGRAEAVVVHFRVHESDLHFALSRPYSSISHWLWVLISVSSSTPSMESICYIHLECRNCLSSEFEAFVILWIWRSFSLGPEIKDRLLSAFPVNFDLVCAPASEL